MAEKMKIMQPCLVVFGDMAEISDAYIIAEKTVVCRVSADKAVVSLLAVYFVFNMEYPAGLTSVFTMLEIVLLQMRPAKVSIVVDRALSAISYISNN